jgi:hypothetical protein
MRVLDGRTLAIPNRKGNRRADTFHNLMTCDQLSMAVTVSGRDELLHLQGTAFVTDDADLLATMALREKPPTTALVVAVERAEIAPNAALRSARIWDPAAHAAMPVPDLNQVAAHHLAENKTRGAKASVTRAMTKGLAKSPASLVRRALDLGYRKDLKSEGYDDA